MSKVANIAIGLIRENPVALRTVDRESESYIGLIASIKQQGFMGAITVRSREDTETGETYYELVDGLHRYSAAKDAGLSDIPANIVTMDSDSVMEAQILANIHKIETKPMDYTNQLKRILSRNPLMTEAVLAQKVAKSPQWISQRLGLTKITNPKIVEMVNEGIIVLSNAYALAKLPDEEQLDFLERAQSLSPEEFIPACNERVKELRKAQREGRSSGEAEFIAQPHLQKMKDIKEALESGDVAKTLCSSLNSPEEGFAMALKYALNIDPESIKVQEADFDERKAAKAEREKKRTAEKAAKKEVKAKKALEEAEVAKKAADANA